VFTYNEFKYFGQTIEDEDENNKYNNNKRLWIHAIDLFQAAEMFISTLVKGNKTSDANPHVAAQDFDHRQ